MKSDEEFLEDALIGGLIMNAGRFHEVASIIKPSDFVCSSAKACWLKMLELYKGGRFDLGEVYISLASAVDKAWLSAATTDTMPSNLISRAKAIAELSKKRRIKAAISNIAGKAGNQDVRADWLLEDIVAIYKSETGEVDRDSSVGAVINRFKQVQQANKEKGFIGMSTGFQMLDSDFMVYQPGHLWVIGAWTSVGKTAFMVEAVNRFFDQSGQGRVAVFSTEMTEEQNIARILANRTGVNASVILSGKTLDQHAKLVENETEWLADKNLFIYDKLRNIDDIMAQCRKLKYAGGIDLIWIDFIQNVHRPGAGESQYAMVSQIAKDLQALAHDLRATIVCLSQLPNHAGREDSGILEFKGAGEIAAACDIGVLMKRSKEDNKRILFDVRKNRHGKTGQYFFEFDPSWTRILEKEVVE